MFRTSESGHAVSRSDIVIRYTRRFRTTIAALFWAAAIPLGMPLWGVAVALGGALVFDLGFWWVRNRGQGLLSPELANAALDLLPAVFFVLDQSGAIRYWNARFAAVSSTEEGRFHGERLYQFFADEDRQSIIVAVTRALTRGVATVEAEFVGRDGERIPMLIAGIRVNLGGTYRLIGVGQDISARKEAEAQLRRQEEQYRLLAENVTDVVVHLDPATNLRYVSPSVEPLLGYDPSAMSGTKVIDLVHPDDRKQCIHDVQTALANNQRPRIEFRVQTKDRGYLWVESVGKELVTEGPRNDLIFTTRDISKRKAREVDLVEAREKAERASRLKSAFLANMSHEIRTPLTSVIGFSEVLEEEADGEHAHFARLVRESSIRLKEVLDSVLRLSKLEVGAVEFEPEDLDLATEVERTVELLQPQAAEKDLSLHMDVPDEVPARLDPGATGRILDNLVTNAIKYTPSGGEVDVRLRVDESWAELQVDDTGRGIKEDLLPNLFEPFVQSSSQNGSEKGSGLGLAITKRLVDGMNGQIDVDTEPGKGTCFTVRLDRRGQSTQDEPDPS